MTINKRLLLAGVIVLAFIFLGFVLRFWVFDSSKGPGRTEKVAVVASFYPLEDVAKQVGGDLIKVTTVTPEGVEPHEYELTPQNLVDLYGAKLILLNGRGVDSWGDKLIDQLHSKGIKAIRMSDLMGGADPHIWLDPTNMERQADVVAAALAELDPRHALNYNEQRDEYKKDLATLDQEYRDGLAKCATREIVTAHDAFGYLARRYNLTSYHLLGLSPEEDPSPARLAEVATIAKQKKMKTVFFETLVDPRLAQALAREIGAKTKVLTPIEGRTPAEAREGKGYADIMRDNLGVLREALDCI